jgi:molybdenum cofactor cytidylyltransferase
MTALIQISSQKRLKLILSDAASRSFDSLRPGSRELVTRTMDVIAEMPEAGIPLIAPLQNARVFTVSPGIKVVYFSSDSELLVLSIHVSPLIGMHRTGRFGAIVLAAGQEKCAGKPVQVYPLDEGPCLIASLSAFTAAHVNSTILVVGAESKRILNLLEKTPQAMERLTMTYNSNFKGPMIRSIQVGLKVMEPGLEGLLLSLGNRPFVRPETIQHIIKTFENERPLAVRPWFGNRPGHPVLFDSSLVNELLTISSGSSARTVLEKHSSNVLDLQVKDAGVVTTVREFHKPIKNA